MAELAAVGGTLADDFRDLLVIKIEDVVQEEDGTFRGRECFEEDEKRNGR